MAWPVSADWTGTRVEVLGDDRDPGHHDGAAVVAFEPSSGTLVARRAGSAVLRVTMNGVTRRAADHGTPPLTVGGGQALTRVPARRAPPGAELRHSVSRLGREE
ncbi:hypothetical protein GCM10010254_24930 [Streptomyces chromofuscus]|nr:hypothetical protein GCM10010254_24930 [Streptomyces chromofuscus]